jgi:hypothetical protein
MSRILPPTDALRKWNDEEGLNDGGYIMSSPIGHQHTHREEELTALDVCGGVLVLLILLVATVLAASVLDHVSRFLVDFGQALIHSVTPQGAGLC